MSDTWGTVLQISIFGESHGPAIGAVLDGLPGGIPINPMAIDREMRRRAPGRHKTATARRENDEVEILSGVFEGKTTGSSLCGIIRNKDTRSGDYRNIARYARPGHADYTGFVRYQGYNDYRGGGHFSGRLTAPLVFAGAICKEYLLRYGIQIWGRCQKIAGITDEEMDPVSPVLTHWIAARERDIPTLSPQLSKEMEAAILKAKNEGDSVGGVVEILVPNLPAGLGNPFFDSLESAISHLAFSVPAVKGIEFGDGFALSEGKGSLTNDSFYMDGETVATKTNHNGGILGGITSGMPLVFRTAIKPTASIGLSQRTVDLKEKQDATFVIKGRHDPCIVPRAVPVLEAVTAIALTDILLLAQGVSPLTFSNGEAL